jgi:hypothetical protein
VPRKNDLALGQLPGYEHFSKRRKAHLLKLNIQTPCPPRGGCDHPNYVPSAAVSYHTRWGTLPPSTHKPGQPEKHIALIINNLQNLRQTIFNPFSPHFSFF